MKKLLLGLLLLTAGTLSAQEARRDTIVPKYLIQGYFFNEKPEALPDSLNFGSIVDSEGNKVIFERFPAGRDLSDRAKAYAIPVEQVRNGKELLDKYATAEGHWFIALRTPYPIHVGDKFPKFKEKDIDGRTWTNGEVKGKAMVLNLWYTGCGPCIREMPLISAWQKECPDAVFFSSTYEKADLIRPVVERRKFTYHHLVEVKDFTKWVVNGYPLTILVDKKGIIRRIESGTSLVQRDELLETLKRLERE